MQFPPLLNALLFFVQNFELHMCMNNSDVDSSSGSELYRLMGDQETVITFILKWVIMEISIAQHSRGNPGLNEV